MRPEDQFHVGIVVEDFEAALYELADTFGYRWCAEIGGPTTVRLATGEAVLDLRCAYSRTSPRLEVVRRVPGTIWEPTGSGLHHVGYWSDDLGADCARLERAGHVAQATRVGADDVASFAFYRGPTGLLVELVSRASQPSLERYWSGLAQPGTRPAQPGTRPAQPDARTVR